MGAVATVALPAHSPYDPVALDAVRRSLPGSVRVVVLRWPPGGLTVRPEPPDAPDTPSPLDGPDTPRGGDHTGWLADPAIVSVAAVSGALTATGLQLALTCDLRVFADDVLWTPGPVGAGVDRPDPRLLAPLVRLLGYPRALELCLTGRRVGADDAVRAGVATVAVPAAELLAAVDDLVAALLATDRDAATLTKALMLRVIGPAEGRPGGARESRMAAWI